MRTLLPSRRSTSHRQKVLTIFRPPFTRITKAGGAVDSQTGSKPKRGNVRARQLPATFRRTDIISSILIPVSFEAYRCVRQRGFRPSLTTISSRDREARSSGRSVMPFLPGWLTRSRELSIRLSLRDDRHGMRYQHGWNHLRFDCEVPRACQRSGPVLRTPRQLGHAIPYS